MFSFLEAKDRRKKDTAEGWSLAVGRDSCQGGQSVEREWYFQVFSGGTVVG